MVNGSAQLCTGSLGDPVLNTTFGNTAAPLGRKTSYSYVTECPGDGSYTIAHTSPGCFGETWHALNQDHTGDPNGMMMIVNASFEPGDFYVDTVNNLCSNTTYEFAVWIANILKQGACSPNPILPDLTLSIETVSGVVIKSVKTGPIAAGSFLAWQQFGSFFTTTNSTSVVIRLTNNADGGCGNDIVLDDITFRPCGPQVSAKIENNSDPAVYNLCEGKSANLVLSSEVSAGYANPVYQWQRSINAGTSWQDIAGATSLTLPVTINANTAAAQSLYRLTVAQQQNATILACRIASNTLTVNLNALPKIDIYSNSPVCTGSTIKLAAHDATTYTWSGPNYTGNTDSVIVYNAEFVHAGTYSVTATSAVGCTASASTNVVVIESPTATAGGNVSICEGGATNLFASGGVAYNWLPPTGLSNANSATPSASPADTTIYMVVVTNAKGCTDTAYTTVNIWHKPVANAGANKEIMEGQSVQLNGTAGGTNLNYSWSPILNIDNFRSLTPQVSPTDDVTYTLTVQSGFGCGIATDDVFVRVFKKLLIPNAFSPNGDGINDSWLIKNLNTYPEATVKVFNRYGQPVFASSGGQGSWLGTLNGKPLPVATYYYVIDIKHQFPLLTGWVMILK